MDEPGHPNTQEEEQNSPYAAMPQAAQDGGEDILLPSGWLPVALFCQDFKDVFDFVHGNYFETAMRTETKDKTAEIPPSTQLRKAVLLRPSSALLPTGGT